MTLGRALLDTGDLAAARTEFEIVLKGAPDNILASRFLGECLEGLGDLAAARDRFKATLALAPSDKQVTAHLQELEAKLKKASGAPAPGAAAPAATRAAEEAPVAPIPLSRVDEPMELERPVEVPTVSLRPEPSSSPEATVVIPPMAAPSPVPAVPAVAPASKPQAAEPPPIPLVAAEEDFELERPYEAPLPTSHPPAETAAAPAPPAHVAGSFESSGPAAEFEFDLAPESGAAPPAPAPWHPEPVSPPASTVRMEPSPEPPAEPPIPAPARTAAPPLPPPVFAPAPPPPPPPRMEAAPPPPPPAPKWVPPPELASPPAPAPAPEADDLTSSTLAELYFNQGFTDKAIEVYRQLLQREPGNERGRARLAELQALERRLEEEEARAVPGRPPDAAASRRQAIERTIARLEGLLASLKKD